jgi:uncharacterized membrane protein
MYRKYLIAAGVVVALAAPAFAATTYYVSQDKTTHKCYVVTKIGQNGMQIGTTGYPTRVKAKVALKAAPECKAKV